MPERAAYLELAEALTERIARSCVADRLPSEHQLAATHGVSRITARAALQELERRHLVQRVRGVGTFVAPRIDYVLSPTMPPSWTETVRAAGHEAHSEVTALLDGLADRTTASLLGLRPGDPLVVVERRSSVNGNPAGVGLSHLPADLVPGLAERLDGSGSLYRTLLGYGHVPARASVRAELAVVPEQIVEGLGVDGRPLAWRIESRNRCSRTGRVLEHSVGWLRADVLRVVFELEEHGGGRTSRRPGGPT